MVVLLLSALALVFGLAILLYLAERSGIWSFTGCFLMLESLLIYYFG